MATQQERPGEKNIAYELKATQALEFAREIASKEGKELVSFEHLVQGINSQIPPQEKPDLYKAYGIDERDLRLNTVETNTNDFIELLQLDKSHPRGTELQFSPRVQRAIQYAEELAAPKQNQTLDIIDLFRGTVKVTDDEHETQKARFLNSTL